jgi:cell division protease FtsH
VDWLTIVPSERGSLGFLATRPDEEGHSVTLDATRRRLAVLMAGREAERLCGGEGAVSAGARSDLLQATRQATAAVSEWGFDAVWGPVAREGLPPGSGSAQLDERVRAWVETARTLAERLLTDNRDLLDAVTEALLEAESLDGEDLAEILRGRFDMEQRRAAIG